MRHDTGNSQGARERSIHRHAATQRRDACNRFFIVHLQQLQGRGQVSLFLLPLSVSPLFLPPSFLVDIIFTVIVTPVNTLLPVNYSLHTQRERERVVLEVVERARNMRESEMTLSHAHEAKLPKREEKEQPFVVRVKRWMHHQQTNQLDMSGTFSANGRQVISLQRDNMSAGNSERQE